MIGGSRIVKVEVKSFKDIDWKHVGRLGLNFRYGGQPGWPECKKINKSGEPVLVERKDVTEWDCSLTFYTLPQIIKTMMEHERESGKREAKSEFRKWFEEK